MGYSLIEIILTNIQPIMLNSYCTEVESSRDILAEEMIQYNQILKVLLVQTVHTLII